MKVKQNTNYFLCVDLIFKEVFISNYVKSNFINLFEVFMNVDDRQHTN